MIGGYLFSFLFFNSWVRINMCLISFVVYLSVKASEKKKPISSMSFLSILFSVFYFGSQDLLFFYFFFEIVLFPIILIIFFFGSQPEKMGSIYYVFIYTRVLSLPFLVELFKMEGWRQSFYFSPLQQIVVVGLFLRKSPIYLLHIWLPKTHVEAPTSTSMVLAGVLLKVGLFGFIKMIILINIVQFFSFVFSLIGLIISPIVTILSVERKVIGAYRRISHINIILYGVNLMSNVSMNGGYIASLRHGFISSLLFCLIGMVYHLNGVRILYYLSGIMVFSTFYRVIIILIFLGNVGVPPILSFWRELLIMCVILSRGFFIYLFMFMYFILRFYFSIFIIVNLLKSKIKVNFSLVLVCPFYLRLLIVFNIIIFFRFYFL